MDLPEAKRAFIREATEIVNAAEGVKLGVQIIEAQERLIKGLQDELTRIKQANASPADQSGSMAGAQTNTVPLRTPTVGRPPEG